MMAEFSGYDLIDLSVQDALRAIFEGGCVEPCTGPRCNCREELVALVQAAYHAGAAEIDRWMIEGRPISETTRQSLARQNAATEQAQRHAGKNDA